MTQIRRRIGDYAASKFLNSQDVLRDGPGPAVITSVSEREVQDEKSPGGKRLALMIEFDRWQDKGYDCNTTNIRVLQDMLGEDVGPDDLRGVRVFVTTHETNFGRGILFQPPQDSMQAASAAGRQKIADARARYHAPRDEFPPPALRLQHSHDPGSTCNPNYCDVARARSLGHEVLELWPQPADNPPPADAEEFVPMHQTNASHAGQRAAAHREPSLGHANEQLPPPTDAEIPF